VRGHTGRSRATISALTLRSNHSNRERFPAST
jgi:hypothetical protein